MLALLILAATLTAITPAPGNGVIHVTFTSPAFGEIPLVEGRCARVRRVPADWDSVRCIVDVFPEASVAWRWSDTLYTHKGDGVFYDHESRGMLPHMVKVTPQRLARHTPPYWIDACRGAAVRAVPVP